jgi:hypothetical protein
MSNIWFRKIYGFKHVSLVITLVAVLLALIFSLVIFPEIQQPFGLSIDPDKNGDLSRNIFTGKGFI